MFRWQEKNFTYNIGLIVDRVRTKITQLDVPPFQTGPQGQEANKAFYIREGESFGAMYGYSFLKSLDELGPAAAASTTTTVDDTSHDLYYKQRWLCYCKRYRRDNIRSPIKKLDENGNLWYGKIGDSNPKFKVAMTNNLHYKGFGLYALIEWKNGGDIYNKSAQWLTRDDRHGMMDQFGKPDYLKKTISYYKSILRCQRLRTTSGLKMAAI